MTRAVLGNSDITELSKFDPPSTTSPPYLLAGFVSAEDEEGRLRCRPRPCRSGLSVEAER